MQVRERREEVSQPRQGPGSGDPTGGDLDAVRQAGESLFQAADDAIKRALSGDSLAFLQATQQEGGQ